MRAFKIFCWRRCRQRLYIVLLPWCVLHPELPNGVNTGFSDAHQANHPYSAHKKAEPAGSAFLQQGAV
ncbi:hypothetical protein HMPREF9080_03020 [Cardiobacterium valvarum F0432]|uniref:Uncharacterized protein n=1 Tax=Cardiobacterium valvarum F0432 TaxID=797473 RepID=G9ZJQ0_9GAMM|nr:hypothetical protein HMPREF9080_03020 [Cardiobacterium valvarum F0432]